MEADFREPVFVDIPNIETVIGLDQIADKLALVLACLQPAEAQPHRLDFANYQLLELSPFDDTSQLVADDTDTPYKLITRASGEQIFWFGPQLDLGDSISRHIRDYDHQQRLEHYTDIRYYPQDTPAHMYMARYQWLYQPDSHDLVTGCRWANGSLTKNPEAQFGDLAPAWEQVVTDWFDNPYQRQQDEISQSERATADRSQQLVLKHGKKTYVRAFQSQPTPDGNQQQSRRETQLLANFGEQQVVNQVVISQQLPDNHISSLKISCLDNPEALVQASNTAVGQLAVQNCDDYFLLQEIT